MPNVPPGYREPPPPPPLPLPLPTPQQYAAAQRARQQASVTMEAISRLLLAAQGCPPELDALWTATAANLHTVLEAANMRHRVMTEPWVRP